MVLGHLLRRVRALVGRTWNKDEDIHANENPSLNKAEPDELCWICLEGASSDANLVQHCACPRVVHDKCMARWQLQSAGKDEERHCRFCKRRLPDWKARLTPANVVPSRTAVMAVVLNGTEHRITVEPGRTGRKQFEREIRRLFNLSREDELEFTFDCQAPTEAEVEGEGRSMSLQLEGKGAFEAAFHCAAVTAALRAQKKVQGHERSGT